MNPTNTISKQQTHSCSKSGLLRKPEVHKMSPMKAKDNEECEWKFHQNDDRLLERRLQPRSTGFSFEKKVFFTFVLISSAYCISPSSSFSSSSQLSGHHSDQFQLYATNEVGPFNQSLKDELDGSMSCSNGLLTFELSTGFIYKPASAETLAMMPSTLQLTDCLDYCLHNASCMAINFEMGLCVLLSSSAKQNPNNLYSSQFPVFTIYAEKKCLISGDIKSAKQRRRCQRAWSFERVAGYEMKTRPKRRLKLSSKELCMEACLLEREFECRSANWYRQASECTLSDQDRHSVSQPEVGDQQVKGSFHDFYGPSNMTSVVSRYKQLPQTAAAAAAAAAESTKLRQRLSYYVNNETVLQDRSPYLSSISSSEETNLRQSRSIQTSNGAQFAGASNKHRHIRQLFSELHRMRLTGFPRTTGGAGGDLHQGQATDAWPNMGQYVEFPVIDTFVDYLENNCVYEPNKLCEFRKIQNRVLKTVDSIYQDVANLDECKQKCLSAPYRCYSFDYGDTSERVCRTSHLDQASLLSVKEPYLDVVGAITYELASCFNVTIQCKAKEMVALVSSSKMFKGKIYVKSRPSSCMNDVRESLQFELSMRYHDEACNVQASSTSKQGVFSNDIVIQHHDRIVTTQDVGLSVYCHYDLGNKSITNNLNLAIERFDDEPSMESKTQLTGTLPAASRPGTENGSGPNAPLMITSLATTVVRSPNVTMRITNMNGQPVASATVGDRLALLFEIKEKSSPFGIFVREIIAMDGKQFLQTNNNNNGQAVRGSYHYAAGNGSSNSLSENNAEAMYQANKANSVQFIDSDGCPTDANLMGPLVKMDAAGHRVLAPFDAFKFPTSDMVFFRAVVTSCFSECKPVVCPQQKPDSSDTQKVTESTPVAGSSTTPISAPTPTPTPTAQTEPTSTMRHMPARNTPLPSTFGSSNVNSNGSSRMTTYSSSSSLTTPGSAGTNQDLRTTNSPHGQPTTLSRWNSSSPIGDEAIKSSLASTLDLSQSKSKFHPSTFGSVSTVSSTSLGSSGAGYLTGENLQKTTVTHATGDSLTTVPGFGIHESWPLTDASSVSQQAEQVDMGGQLQMNMTNNHQGKPPARPTMANSSPHENFAGASINLDSLTAHQKQEIVKLFKTKLKQPQGTANNGSISEMTDLYTGFLASLMLNGGVQNGSDQSESISDDHYKRQHGSSSTQLSTGAYGDEQTVSTATTISAPLRLANLKRFLVHLLNESRLNKSDERVADIIRILEQPKQIVGSQVDVTGQNGELYKVAFSGNNYLYNYNDLSNLDASNQSSVLAQQTFDQPLAGNSLLHSDAFSPSTQIRSQQQQQQQEVATTNGNHTVTTEFGTITKVRQEIEANEKQRKKNKSNLQLLADSYLGAFQSYGRGRKRRQVEESVTADYVYLKQPQLLTVASSLADLSGGAKFTQGAVEMYHLTNVHRFKREAQPFYDMDELVVQSIKIVDRLKFEDDGSGNSNNNSKSNITNNNPKRQSLSKGSLVTGSQLLRSSHNLTIDNEFSVKGQSELSSSDEDRLLERQQQTLFSWSNSGALSLAIILLSFLFVQVFLVFFCLINWNHTKLKRTKFRKPMPVIDYYSSIKNSRASVSTLSSPNNTTPNIASDELSTHSGKTMLTYHHQYLQPFYEAGGQQSTSRRGKKFAYDAQQYTRSGYKM